MLYERVMKQLKIHKEEIESLLLQGTIENFESYRYITGKIKGLEDALDIIREIFKRGDDE